ncbi:uncharacterized protein H6S33_005842 [Morchella sextelata]|uniref:uncharacterized protein n=1 Tax=Morchella sextelata TaxID=1174677 RepID=UPI001D049A0A|nr:uncharacterized protein H6S33_005842 [Morchella sextelata]KAH0613956.1 hypothetical protein H6S33_005842 [Morchella sextelata]
MTDRSNRASRREKVKNSKNRCKQALIARKSSGLRRPLHSGWLDLVRKGGRERRCLLLLLLLLAARTIIADDDEQQGMWSGAFNGSLEGVDLTAFEPSVFQMW